MALRAETERRAQFTATATGFDCEQVCYQTLSPVQALTLPQTTDPLNRTFGLSQTPLLFFLPHKSIIETPQYVIQRTLRFLLTHPIPTACLAAVSPCTLLPLPTKPRATFLPPRMQLFQRQSTSFSASGPLCDVCQGAVGDAPSCCKSCESCSSRCCWQRPHAVKWS